jgi:hypothetical protein
MHHDASAVVYSNERSVEAVDAVKHSFAYARLFRFREFVVVDFKFGFVKVLWPH